MTSDREGDAKLAIAKAAWAYSRGALGRRDFLKIAVARRVTRCLQHRPRA